MSAIQIRQLVYPDSAQLDAVANVATSAMYSDEFTIGVVGGNKDLIFPFERATMAAAAVGGQLWVASYGDTEIAGVAAWYPPGRSLLDSKEQHEAGFDDLFHSFPPELSKWWTEYFLPRYDGLCTKGLGEGVKTASWHLQMLTVLPEHQGKGVGGAPLRREKECVSKLRLRRIPSTLRAYLAIKVAIYKKWGFEVKAEDKIDSSTGTVPIWVMYKAP
ncbi:hypothetical protein GLOTRDRAFT_93592 [Gloeophyllum trabeum ATCC 11539]|uniref:N-acetyltransferase domain-containing protein n=1 Tax=Gloeophyllum trabeum (strain ATCC 11539 / FP-39264 / Madison 617) TaxID=670483 RepID=S7Q693_GLOTA|nr:uncharacterized protein GLOTRDRAFT_93592 [Gloeophyllum trabeum ATCC 11539]EPQ55012.1 hypothetical protein GLOTRDRAFT_93592 [Gloeophyllum trabeum ATCC 11539]